MNNPYDNVDAIRKILPVVASESEVSQPRYDEVYWDAMEKMAVEQESNYIEQSDYRTVLLDHRIHIHQLRECVTKLEAHARSVDRVLKYIIGGSLFFAAVLGFIAWMSR